MCVCVLSFIIFAWSSSLEPSSFCLPAGIFLLTILALLWFYIYSKTLKSKLTFFKKKNYLTFSAHVLDQIVHDSLLKRLIFLSKLNSVCIYSLRFFLTRLHRSKIVGRVNGIIGIIILGFTSPSFARCWRCSWAQTLTSAFVTTFATSWTYRLK